MSDSQPKPPFRSILIVDLSHCFWNAALGATGTGGPNGARDSVVRSIRSLSSAYDRVAIACDGKKQSFRAKIWPKYKADRKGRPDHLWSLLADTVRHLGAAGFHVFEAPDIDDESTYEADDVIGSLAQWCVVERGARVDILSGDSDLCQLVDDTAGVRLLRNYKGITAYKAEDVGKWLGVYPASVRELKALAGDAGDGYGDLFPGIGDKTAIELLKVSNWSAREGVQKVIDAVAEYRAAVERGDKVPKDKVPSAKRITIADLGMDQIEKGYALADVCRDVPLDFESLDRKKEPENLPELGARMVPEDAPAEPAAVPRSPSASASHVPDAEIEESESAEDAPLPAPRRDRLAIVSPRDRMLIDPAEMKQQLLEFAVVLKTVLVPNVDYGKIPGCGDKDVLSKSGAEKLAEVYGFAPQFKLIDSKKQFDRDAPLFYFEYKCILRRKSDKTIVSECDGSCNSWEKKYDLRWEFERNVPAHLDLARLKKKQITIRKGENAGKQAEMYAVPNESIFDQVNTVQKMAQKRAFVGAVLIATRASGQFSADLDDLLDAQGTVNPDPQWEQ